VTEWLVFCGNLIRNIWVKDRMTANALEGCLDPELKTIKFEQIVAPQLKRTLYESLLTDAHKLTNTSTATGGKLKLTDMIIGICNAQKDDGFRSCQIPAFTSLCKAMVDTMWVLEPHAKSFADRGMKLPSMFRSPNEPFNDTKSKKQKKPSLSCASLEDLYRNLSSQVNACPTLMTELTDVDCAVRKLLNCIQDYSTYLGKQRQAVNFNHHMTSPTVSRAQFVIAKHHPTTSPLTGVALQLAAELEVEDMPFCLSTDLKSFVAMSAHQRFSFVQGLRLLFPVMRYTHTFKGSTRNLIYVWRSPRNFPEENSAAVIQKILPTVKEYHTRQMKQDFAEKFGLVVTISPAVRRSVYGFLTDDATPLNKLIDSRLEHIIASNGNVLLFLPADVWSFD